MSGPIVIAGRTFKTKAELLAEARRVRDAYPDNAPIVGADFDFLCGLFSRHPRAVQKLGLGIDQVTVRTDTRFKTRCFWIMRLDGGTETDISFRECISPAPPLADFIAACRNAAAAQVLNFKSRAFVYGSPVCGVTGAPLLFGNCHVDHEPPDTFAAILDAWVETTRINPLEVEIVGHGDGETALCIASSDLLDSWQAFHRSRARLRLLSVEAHKGVSAAHAAHAAHAKKQLLEEAAE